MKIFAIVKNCLLTAALAAGVSVATTAFAHTFIYEGFLSGANESPVQITPGTGHVLVTLDLDLNEMRIQASFSDLRGTVTQAHIHCCTTIPFTATVGVATTLPFFEGFPVGVTAGVYDKTLDLTLASSWNPSFVTASGGIGGALNRLEHGLAEGRAYFNIHTSVVGGGEIRSFLVPVPEPETYALLLAGLGLMALTAVRRKRG